MSSSPDPSAERCQFASDNYAGVCPEALEAMVAANAGYAPAYGNDLWTTKASDCLREVFETDCEVFFVFNGTAANSLALSALCQSYHSIVASELAHVETDECGAPEFFSNGTKLLLVSAPDGKVDLDAVANTVTRRSDIHYPKPKVLSLTQSTELGTVYTPDELALVRETADRYDLHVHMDGARFANAVASLGVAPRTLTWEAGVDVLCFGGTKMGMAVGEAVVFFNADLAREFEYRCKQAGQLASKMRYLAAPWLGVLQDGAWLRHAAHANAMARRLGAGAAELPGVSLMVPVEANAVFLSLPESMHAGLKARGWRYYGFIGVGGARLMCSWATTPADVDALLADLRDLAGISE